jgi:predicted PurR-regulated permease PerM
VNEGAPLDAGRPAIGAWVRQFAALWGFALFVVVVLVAFRAVILPFVVGLLVAYVLAPIVGRLSSTAGRPGLPRWLSVLVVYVGLSAAIGLFLTAFLPHLSGDLARLFRELPRFLQRIKHEDVPRIDAWLEQTFPQGGEERGAPRPERKLKMRQTATGEYEVSLEGLELEIEPAGKQRWVVGPRSDGDEPQRRLGDLIGSAASATQTELKQVLLVGQRFVSGVLRSFAWFILTFMVAAYLLVDPERVMSFLRSLVPGRHQATFDELVAEMDRGLAGVVRGQLAICAVNGVLTTIGLFLFKVKYALLLGLVAGAMSFIPVFGSILSSVPIVTVALASGLDGFSLSTGLAVLGWIVGIHLLEANVFNPKILGSAAKMHPVLVVFALLVGEETGGLIGALLAVPVASMVQSAFLFFRHRSPLQAVP